MSKCGAYKLIQNGVSDIADYFLSAFGCSAYIPPVPNSLGALEHGVLVHLYPVAPFYFFGPCFNETVPDGQYGRLNWFPPAYDVVIE